MWTINRVALLILGSTRDNGSRDGAIFLLRHDPVDLLMRPEQVHCLTNRCNRPPASRAAAERPVR
jgi:hypothetical protein